MTKIVLTVLTWIRRHPWETLAILVLLYLLPAPETVIFRGGDWLFKNLGKWGGIGIALRANERFQKAVSATVTWLQSDRNQWVAAATLVIVAPLVGFFACAWLIVKKFKPATELTIVPAPGSNQ